VGGNGERECKREEAFAESCHCLHGVHSVMHDQL
jgi:hypothetical protein